MADVIRFQLRLRPPPSGRPDRRRSALIEPFPFSRRRHLVELHARVMRGLSVDDGEIYLTKALEQVCEELSELGRDCHLDCGRVTIFPEHELAKATECGDASQELVAAVIEEVELRATVLVGAHRKIISEQLRQIHPTIPAFK